MRSVAAAAILFIAFVLLAATSQFVIAAPSSSLTPGDRLEYAVAVELQQHHVRASAKPSDKVTESSAQGTATFTIYSIGQDGTALATIALRLQGTDAGQPVAMQTVAPGKILPDGQLRIGTPVGLGISEAFAAANTAIAEMMKHQPLVPGKTWTNPTKNNFVIMTMTRKIVGDTNNQGRRALTLQSVGTGRLERTADGKPASGDISIGGTTYYDGDNHLLIGEALRTLTVVAQPGTSASHDDYSSTYNIVLDTWYRQSPAPAASVQAVHAEPSAEESTPTPAPTPLPPLYSTPYPSPTSSAAP